MFNRVRSRAAVLGLLGTVTLLAQDAPLPTSSVSVNLPADSPVLLLNMSTGSSRKAARGAALMLDLNLSLTLKNTSLNRIHGVTLRVVSQEIAVGGAATVFQPSLNVGPGEAFPIHIVARLFRPNQSAAGPLVQVNLDGVLFQDLSFYGPDQLQSRRRMTACEMEAQRDRDYLKRVLAQNGAQGLKEAMLKILARQDTVPQLNGGIIRGGHSITSGAIAAVAPESHAEFALLQFSDAPVRLVRGSALVAGNEARAAEIEVRNVADKPLKYVELGWILTDPRGRQYMAYSMPSADAALRLPRGATTSVSQQSSLSFTSNGQPVTIQKMTGFVSQVEFADGKVWVPSRQNVDDTVLAKVLAPSAEEQRLAALYLRKGVDALAEELKKF